MALNNDFKIKNNLNTLGQILSSGVDIASIFSPANTTFTVAANTGNNFTVAGGQTETFTGTNGINTSTASGTRTVTISGVPATTSSMGVASFSSGNFAVTNGAVSIKQGGVGATELNNAIDNVSVGATTPSTGRFTTLTTTGATTLYGTVSSAGAFTTNQVLSSNNLIYGRVVDASVGYRVAGGATSGNVLRGDGTNFVSSALAASDIASGQALTKVDDTNVTLTLGGTPGSALLKATTITAGWSGQLGLTRGGTGSSDGSITGSGALTFAAGGTNENINLTPSGTGVVATSKAGITGGNIDGTVIGATTKAAGSFTTLAAVDNLTANTAGKNVTLGASTSTGQTVINSGTTGTIDNIAIGNTTRSSGKFTTLDANNAVTLSPSTGTVTVNPTNIGAIDNVVIGATTARDGTFTNLHALSASVNGNLFVGGTLYLAGSATTINQNQLTIDDPIIYLANSNPDDSFDIGFVGHNVVGGVYGHTGLLRSHGNGNPGTWYLFSSMTSEPSANDISGAAKVIDTLVANTSGSHTGNATTATTLQTARTISIGSGDVTGTATSFNGSTDITIPTTINSNAVTYAKIQQVGALKVLGNPSGSTANVSEIPASAVGFAVLSASSASAGATTLGVGSSDDVTFKSVTVNNGTKNNLTNIYNASVTGSNTLTVNTFANSSYNTAKFTVQIKNTVSNARAALEVIATKNDTTWEGTVYGIIDPAGLFTDVDIATPSSTVNLVFILNGNANYSVTVLANALND